MDRVTAGVDVVLPQGPGPFPTVVQMHGCGGIGSPQRHYAKAAKDIGVAAVTVDSLGPRGIGEAAARMTVCTGLRLRGAERAGDLLVVLDWLERQPWADMGHVAAIGWSHGAWAIMEALAAEKPDRRAGAIKLAALFYPYAGLLARTAAHGWGAHRPKVFACLAGRDAVVGRLAPERAITRLQADGLDVEILRLPEATHCFDDDDGVDPRSRYRPDLKEQATTAYVTCLRRTLLD